MAPSTNDPSTNSPTDSDLAIQVAALETDVQQIDDSEVQAKVQQLIKLIRTTLKSQDLSHKTQKELARLLSLISSLDNRHIQQLNLLDLAISILLEPEEPKPTSSSASKRLRRDSGEAKNLTFVQETRRQVAQQSRPYPDVLRAIITGRGTPYIRLITGLTWFFCLFFGVPALIYGLSLAATNLTALKKVSEYQTAQIELERKDQEQQEQIKDLTQRNNNLLAELGRIRNQLPKAPVDEVSSSPGQPSSSSNSATPLRRGSPSTQTGNPIPANAQTQTNPSSNPPTPSATTVEIDTQTLNNIQQSIENRIEEDAQQVIERPNNSGTQEQTNQPTRDTSSNKTTRTNPAQENALTNKTGLSFNTGPWLILLAISMGALGGTVSVIVRADTFIRQAQETDNDLFLTGFFRPFVGMSFAIFCVALVEAGVFSGIFDLSNRSQADRTYFYVAIAFVAGFSERLVRDVVIKTEDTLAGPPNIS